MRGLRVAVTGANGFIGTHLCRQLATDGAQVIGVGRSAAPRFSSCSEWFEVDDYAREPERLRRAFRGAQAVVHLAGFAHGSRRPSIDPVAVNVAITRSVFESAAAEGIGRFVNMSSIGAVVARSDAIVSDSTPPGEVSRYGLSKREAERYLAEAAPGAGVMVTNLRPPAVYGPDMRGKSATLFKLVARRIPLPIGGVTNRRSFLFVGNLTAAVSMVLASPGISGSFAVSDSDPISTPEFARRIAAAMGREPWIVSLPRGYVALVNGLARVAPFIRFPLDAESVADLHASLPVDSTRFWRTVNGNAPFSMEQGLLLTSTAYAPAVAIQSA